MLASASVAATTLTLECGELNGIRYSMNKQGKTHLGPDGYAGSHPTIVWPIGAAGSQATITMSDATGSPESDPAFVVHLTDESITWVSAQSKATEVWTYVATNHILIYSQQSPRAGTDLSELTPGSGAFGDVMFSTCREGIK
jgi:hypothetical protein